MQIEGAIFDMDGTLVDSLCLWDLLWEKLGNRYFGNPSYRPHEENEKAVRTLTLKDAMLLLHEKEGIGESGEALHRIAAEMCVQFYASEVQIKNDVREFLDALQAKGVKMCIASATAPELVALAMKTCKLEKYFCKVFSCSEIGRGKEFPDVFIQAHRFLGTPKESTWVFEDSITALETASRAGYQTVGIYDRYNFHLDRVAQVSTVYVGEGDSLASLISKI